MSTSSGFSGFMPRFKSSKDSPSSGTASLSPSKGDESSSSSAPRRSSFSLGRRSPSPSPSPALSSKSSFSDFSLSSRANNVSQGSDTTAKIKAPAPPPKLTLTDVEHGESSIHVPSPISTHPPPGQSFSAAYDSPQSYDFGGGMSGTLGTSTGAKTKLSLGSTGGGTMGWADDEDIRTPTGDRADGSSGALGLGFGGLGEGSLTLEDAVASDRDSKGDGPRKAVPAGSSPPSSSRPSSYQSYASPSPPKLTSRNSATSSPYANGNGHSRDDISASSSVASLTPSSSALSNGNGRPSSRPSSPTPSYGELKPESSSKSKRRLSTSSRRSTKPSGGIAAAIASMSKDLVNPHQGLKGPAIPIASTVRSSSPTPTNRSSYRPRAGTGSQSIPSSITSEDSKKSRRSLTVNTKPETPRTSIDDDMRPSIDNGEWASQQSEHGEFEGDESRGGRSELGDYDDDEEEDDDGLDLDDLPVTGFAVASGKRNHDFHLQFKEVPEVDYLIEDYGCALQRDILVQGRLYVSENHVCFHASIFGWVTNMVIPFSEILRIDKKMTAFVIPNAIMISTLRSKYTFASFLSRDTTYDVIHNIWRLSHPHAPSMSSDALINAAQTNSQGSVGEDALAADGAANGKARHLAVPGAGGKKKAVARKPTTCACGLEGKHYTETALDAVFPSTPEKIYNLMFTSGFSKDFMSGNQKLMDIQTSDWAPESSGSNLLTRKMSYIKPLPGGFGPKQTKCELQDETVHVDFDNYVSMVTTTRTPDVPSGGSFSVKTRTCLMWAGASSTRVLVTCQVDWTGRSFIKGIIDSSALAGQKSFHADQETAMRAYIADHLTEFHTEGVEDDDPDESPSSPIGGTNTSSPTTFTGTPLPTASTPAEKKAEQDGWSFQYGIDTFSKGVIEIGKGLWAIGSGMSMQGVLAMVILALVVSNVWTMVSLKGARDKEGRIRRKVVSRTSATREKSPATMGESPDSVAEAVKSFLEDYITRQHLPPTSGPTASSSSPAEELHAIASALDLLESRITDLRGRLPPLEEVKAPSLDELD